MLFCIFLLIFALTINVKANHPLEIKELKCTLSSHSNLKYLKDKLSNDVTTSLKKALESDTEVTTTSEPNTVFWKENFDSNWQSLADNDLDIILNAKNCKILESKLPEGISGYFCGYALKEKKAVGVLCKFEKAKAPVDKIKIITSFDTDSTKKTLPTEDITALSNTIINQVAPSNEQQISSFIDCTKQFGVQLSNNHLKSYPSLQAAQCALSLLGNNQNAPENALHHIQSVPNSIVIDDMCQNVASKVTDLSTEHQTQWSHQGHVSCALIKSLKQENRDMTATCCVPVSKYYVSGLLDCTNEVARVNQQILFFSKQTAEEALTKLKDNQNVEETATAFVTIVEYPDHKLITNEHMCYHLAKSITNPPKEATDSQVMGCAYVWNGAQSKILCLTKRIDDGLPNESKDFGVKQIDCSKETLQALQASNAHFSENMFNLVLLYSANSDQKKALFQSLTHSQDLQRTTNSKLTTESNNKDEILKATPRTLEAVIPYFPTLTDNQYCIAAVNYWLLQEILQPYIFKKEDKIACTRLTNRLSVKILCEMD